MANTVADLVAKLVLDFGDFVRDSSKVNTALKEWDDGVKKATEGFRALGDRLTDVGTRLTAGITAPLAGLAIGVTSVSKDFDLAMRQVSSLLGDSGRSFDDLSAKTLALSKAMGIDATQAAQALYETISADIPKENAISFLETASKAGIAGVTDTKVAVDGLTTVIKSFGLDVADANKVADAMFQTVNIGKVTFPELAAAIGNASGMAHTLGISYQELMAAGATITKQGQPIGEAMTQISSAIRAMIDPSEQMQELFGKLGVESGKALIATNGFEGALQKLRDAAQGNETTLSAAFGRIEGLRGLLALTGDQAAGAASDLDKITNSGGAMQGALDEINKSLSRQLEQLWTQIKDVAIELGQSLLPAIATLIKEAEPLIQWLGDAVKWFTELPGPVQAVAAGFAALAAAIGPVVLVAGQLITSFTAITGLLGSGAGVAGLLSAATPLAIAFGAAIAAWAIYEAVTKLQALNTELDRLYELQQQGVKATQDQAREIEILEKILDRHGKTYDATGKNVEQYLKSLRDAVGELDEFKGKQLAATDAAEKGTISIASAAKEYLGLGESAKTAKGEVAGAGAKISEEMQKHLDKVRESFKRAEDGPRDFAELLKTLDVSSSLAEAEKKLNDIAEAAQRYRDSGDLEAMNRVWAEQPPILAEIEANLSRLPSLVDAIGTGVAGLDISKMTGNLSGFEIPKQVEESWKRTLELTKAGFETSGADARAWAKQVSTIVSDFGKQTADLLIGLFKSDEHNEELKKQEEDLRASLAKRESDLADYTADIESQIAGITEKNAEALAEEEQKLLDSLAEKQAAYDEYAAEVATKIEDLTAKHQEQADKEVAAAEASLQKQMDAFDEYISQYQKKLGDLNKREGRSEEDDAKRIKRANEDYEEGLDDQKKALDKNLRDKKQAYDRDTAELQRKIDAELAKGSKANQESISQWRQQLAQKKVDYDQYVADQQEKLQEWIDDHKTALDRELEDIQTAADRRKQDLAEQKQELDDGVTARRNALDASIAATDEKTALIRASHATELQGEIDDLNAKLNEKKAALDQYKTDLGPKLDALRADAKAELDGEIADLQAKLKEKSDALETWRTGEYATKLKSIEDDFRGVWDRVGGAFAGMLGSAASAITRFVTESLVGSLFKALTGEGGLLSHLGSVGNAIAGIFGGAGSSVASGAGSAAGSAAGAAGQVAGSAGSVAAGLGSSLAGGALAGGLAALGSIVGAAMMGGDLGHIEENTRKAERQLSEGVQPRLDEYLPEMKSIASYMWGPGHGLWVDISSSLDLIEEYGLSSKDTLKLDLLPAALKTANFTEMMANDSRSIGKEIVSAIRDLRSEIAGGISVKNMPDFASILRMQAMTTV